MGNVSINCGSEYLFARLHGLWSKCLHGESLLALTRAEGEQQLARMLGEHGISFSRYDTFQRDMKVRELGILDGLRGSLPAGLAGFYHAFMRLTFYANLKTVFHYRYFDDNSREIGRLLIPSPLGDTPDMDKIAHVETTEDFLKCLDLHIHAEEIGRCVRRLLDNHDVFQAESAMDRLAYAELLEGAKGLPCGIRGEGVGLVGEMTDVMNICMLLRNFRTYHFSAARMRELWLDGGGQVDASLLERLCGCGDMAQLLAGLPYAWRQAANAGGVALSGMENSLWKCVYRHALRVFRDMQELSMPAVAFPFLLHFETLNICRVHEGIHFRMSQRELRELLID